MLSLKYIRENAGYVQDSLTRKQSQVSISALLKFDIQRRNCLKEVEVLRAEKNQVSSSIAELKKGGGNAKEDIAAMRTVSNRIKEVETELRKVEESIANDIYYVPNIVHSSVPVGKDETGNVVIKKWGEVPDFSSVSYTHLTLPTKRIV